MAGIVPNDTLFLPRALIVASAAIVLVLGSLHFLYTFWGPKFRPRDPALLLRMQEVSPVLTRQTTMWKAWIGFNASHALGAILFGLLYGDLALAQPGVLFASGFLLAVGFCFLASLLALAKAYWFSVPFRGVLLALLAYSAALLALLTR